MDYVSIISVAVSYLLVLAFGYVLGAVVFASNLKRRLQELNIDRTTMEMIMERKKK